MKLHFPPAVRPAVPVLVVALALAAAGTARGETPTAAPASADSPWLFEIEGLRWYFAWGVDKVPTGADLTLGYRGWRLFAGVDTILQGTLGGGYEGLETYRNVDYRPHFQIPPEAAAGHNRHLEFNSPNFQWEIGLRQGILWNERLETNWLEGFAFYRGRYERYLEGRHYLGTDPERIAAIRSYHDWWKQNYAGTDAEGIFGSSFLLGLSLDTLRLDPLTRSRDGYYAEASFEASPWLPAVPGATDFWRVSLSLMGFRTLYRAPPQSGHEGLALYLGDYFAVDFADARRAMPTYVMQTFGGRRLRYGLGGEAVRGFEAHSWDTQFKIVNSLELRLNLPAFGRPGCCPAGSPRLEPAQPEPSRSEPPRSGLVPGLLLFLDLGWGAGFWGDPSATPGGFLGSSGIGVYLNLFDAVYAVGYAAVPMIGTRLDGRPLKLDLDFGLHF